MRKILVVTALLLGTLSGLAQEKVMNIQKKDGTQDQTRVADLEKMSFLTVEEGGQGLLVKTVGGETAAVRFEAQPVVTVSDGKLKVENSVTDGVEFEIEDIAEILFGDASSGISITETDRFSYVLQDQGLLLRGIPKGVKPQVYSLDGRCLPTPSVSNGQLLLNRSTLGNGFFIVKVGKFSTKIRL